MTVPVRILDDAPAGWDTLVARDPAAGPGHRPELWAALAALRPSARVRFLAAHDADALAGGVGVIVERRAGFCWIRALPHLLGAAPLAIDGAHARVDHAVARGVATLARETGAVGGEWACYRPRGPEVAGDALAQVPGETTRLETGVVDLAAGIDVARGRMSRRMRQYLRHAPPLEFAEEPGALEEVYVLHLRQAARWPGYRPLPLELSRRLLHQGGPVGGSTLPLARLFTLREAGRLVAGTLFLDHPRELFAWWSGIAGDARGRHRFPLLLHRAVEWAAEHGRERVNLGGSAGRASLVAFKEALGASDLRYPVRWLDASHAGPAGRLVAALQAWLRRGRPRGEPA